MDDEVFVTVEYRLEDFVRARRLALFTRFREANAPQLMLFVGVAAIGVLFFAPDPIGRIFASIAGAFIGLMAVLLVVGLVRTSRRTPLPLTKAAIEVSDTGIIVKNDGHYVRIAWRGFEQIARGQGIFFAMGQAAVVLPMRVLRRDQIRTLDALASAHAADVALSPPPAEKNDRRGAERKDDSDH
jgi:hypothetical protein